MYIPRQLSVVSEVAEIAPRTDEVEDDHHVLLPDGFSASTLRLPRIGTRAHISTVTTSSPQSLRANFREQDQGNVGEVASTRGEDDGFAAF